MDEQDEGPHPNEVTGPAEGEQRDGRHVVYEHLPKVFALGIEELRYGKGPVETQLYHVVPPDAGLDGVARVVIPAKSLSSGERTRIQCLMVHSYQQCLMSHSQGLSQRAKAP